MRIPTVQLKADKNKCEAIIDGTKGSMVPVWERISIIKRITLVALSNDMYVQTVFLSGQDQGGINGKVAHCHLKFIHSSCGSIQ